MSTDQDKAEQLRRDREDALLAAEAAMALRMKDGLVEYKKGFSKRVAAYAAIFIVGAVVGAWVSGSGSTGELKADWVGKLSLSHAVDTSQNLLRGDALSIVSSWLGSGFNVNQFEPNLDFLAGSSYEIEGKKVLGLLYFTDANERVGLYFAQTDAADLSEPVVGLRQGLQAATWTKGGVEYLLIGGTDAQLIWNTAKTLSR